jgi:predicted transcriptional regulator
MTNQMKSTTPRTDDTELTDLELKIIYYIYYSGPSFIKKLAARLNEDIHTMRKSVMNLQRNEYLERVTSTLVEYRIDRKNKVTKHRNHTYYDLSRKGKLFIRNFHGKVDVNLRPPYKQV